MPKRSGGERLIHAPKRRLKAIQRRLNGLLVSRLPLQPAAHGFRPQRSVATNAGPHAAKEVVIKLDLKDCFPTITHARVRGLLISLGYSYPVAASLAVLMTEPPRQPVEAEGKIYHVPIGPRVCVQGGADESRLCNAVLMRLDRRLAGLARKHDFAYTRYADDLTFSGNDRDQVKRLIALAGRIVREEGFRLNRAKTRVLRKSQRQQVAGVVVNVQPGLSRQERRRLRRRRPSIRPRRRQRPRPASDTSPASSPICTCSTPPKPPHCKPPSGSPARRSRTCHWGTRRA